MIKFTTSVAAVAALALVDNVDALYRSKYAAQRVAQTKGKLERQYGKGLVGLYGEDGNFDIERLQIAPRGYRAGNGGGAIANINGLMIDATSRSAFWLGFVQGMQYSGLNRASDVLPNDNVELSNCFASTYALMEDFQTQAYNLNTFASEAGTIKLFDALLYDPSVIFMDFTVEWEMCNGAAIYGQFKSMVGGDYAAISNNATRELLVIATESPEAFRQINETRKAAQCAAKVAKEAKEANDEEDNNEAERGDEGSWQFQADTETSSTDDAKAAGKAAAECFSGVDKYFNGKVAGRLFGSFFDNEQQPV